MMIIQFTLALISSVLNSGPASEPRQESTPDEVLLRSVAPVGDTTVTYSFTEESDLHVDHLRSTMGDDVFERDAPDRSVKQIARREWVDETGAGDAVRHVRRTFVTVGSVMEVTNHRDGAPRPDGNATARSMLTGRTVDFIDIGSGFAARLADEPSSDVEPAVPVASPNLDALECDVSWSGLLPPNGEAVAVGAEWAIDAASMRDVFSPGGRMVSYYRAIEQQQDPDMLARFGGHAVSRFGQDIEGDVMATLVGTERRESGRVARIAIRFDVHLRQDPSPWMRAQSVPFEMAKIGQTAKNATHTLHVVGEGTMTWDLDRHRFLQFEAEAETASDQKLDYAFDFRGHLMAGEEHFEFSGTTKLECSATYRHP